MTFYGSEPSNSTTILEGIRDPRLRGYLVDKSVPWDAVDLPLVTALPLKPKDRAEVNLVLNAANYQIARMVFVASKNLWYQIGEAPVITTLPTTFPTGVTEMEVNYLIDAVNNVVVKMLWRSSTATWTQIGQPPIVTTLPTPADKMEVYYTADATLGVVWHLRYRSASASTYKWEFVGGPPMFKEVGTQETATTTSYTDFATTGPTVTVPLAGDYEITFGAAIKNSTTDYSLMTPKLGAAAASDADCILAFANAVGVEVSCGRVIVRTLAASAAIKLMGRIGVASTGSFAGRFLAVRPVRVV